VVDGAQTCACNNGYTLESGGQTCTDVNECQNNICEDRCKNTEGSFECDCGNGYTLGPDQRKCEDINECIQIDNPVCSGKKVCQNNAGSYTCECPPGTEESNGDCVEMEITEPPVQVIPTDKPPLDTTLGRQNSVNVTLRSSKEEFDVPAQFKFKLSVASEVNQYCLKNPQQCGGDMIEVDSSDVIILDEVVNDANGKATFLMFVYTKNPTDVLSGKVLELILSSVTGVAAVAEVTSEGGESGSSGGLSGGEVAAIVIVVLVVVIAVLIATVIFLAKVKIIPKPQMQMISNLSMDIFRSQDRRSSMLIEEGDGESMKDTVSVSGVEMGAAEAKAKEAAEENEKEAEKEEVKVDLSKAEEAEETV
jgi:hypothetical protein